MNVLKLIDNLKGKFYEQTKNSKRILGISKGAQSLVADTDNIFSCPFRDLAGYGSGNSCRPFCIYSILAR